MTALVLLSTAGIATADPISLDQRSVPSQPEGADGSTIALLTVPSGAFRRAQTFTAGLSGDLARIDVLLSSVFGTRNLVPGDVLLQVLDTVGGVPISTVLASNHSAVNSVDGWRTFELTTPIRVESGRILAIELIYPTEQGGFGWRGQQPGTHYQPGGDFFLNVSAGVPSFTLNPDADNFFRTFVDTAPTPEPTTVVLALMVIAALGLNSRVGTRGPTESWK